MWSKTISGRKLVFLLGFAVVFILLFFFFFSPVSMYFHRATCDGVSLSEIMSSLHILRIPSGNFPLNQLFIFTHLINDTISFTASYFCICTSIEVKKRREQKKKMWKSRQEIERNGIMNRGKILLAMQTKKSLKFHQRLEWAENQLHTSYINGSR